MGVSLKSWGRSRQAEGIRRDRSWETRKEVSRRHPGELEEGLNACEWSLGNPGCVLKLVGGEPHMGMVVWSQPRGVWL